MYDSYITIAYALCQYVHKHLFILYIVLQIYRLCYTMIKHLFESKNRFRQNKTTTSARLVVFYIIPLPAYTFNLFGLKVSFLVNLGDSPTIKTLPLQTINNEYRPPKLVVYIAINLLVN